MPPPRLDSILVFCFDSVGLLVHVFGCGVTLGGASCRSVGSSGMGLISDSGLVSGLNVCSSFICTTGEEQI